MKSSLNIITITKDDLSGILATIRSTQALRDKLQVKQIVIDGSAEAISDKLQQFLTTESNVDYIKDKPNGIAAAFNKGVEALNSEWVWFLNGKDEVHPEFDGKLLLQILKSSRADVVIFQIEYMDSKMPARRRPPLWSLWPPLYPNWVPHPATFIRAHLFEQYGVFNTEFKIAMDADWWMRVFSNNVTVDMISIPVVLYDLGGVSAINHVQTDKEARKILRKYFWMLVKKWLNRGVHLFRAYTKL